MTAILFTVIALVVVLAAFGYVGLPLAYERYARRRLDRRAKRFHALVLTFDDGPGSCLTPAILQTLAEHGTKATFFLLGRNIAGREEIVRRIAREGHEICSHGYDHLHHWRVSPVRAIKDIKRGWQAIDAALGASEKKYPFRPPNGKLNLITLVYLVVRRVPIAYWSVDSGDTWLVRPDADHVKSVVERGGAVVLTHDFDRTDDRVSRLVIDSTRTALATARKMAMKTLTYSQLSLYGIAGQAPQVSADSTAPSS